MKKVLLLVLSLGLLFTSCEKGGLVLPEADTDGMLKSAELKMVPIKGELQSQITEYIEGVPMQGLLSGKLSHLGELNAEKSVFHTTLLTFDNIAMTLHWECTGTLCAANGDLLYYTLACDFAMLSNELTGHSDIANGTGRFEHAEGLVYFTGYADDPYAITSMYMTCEGLISNVGSSK